MNSNALRYFNYSELDGGEFRPHQAEGIEFMVMTRKTMCGDPVGAGKTVQAAGLIAHLVEDGVVTTSLPVLWLTEGNALAEQTARELSRFLPDLLVCNLAGDPALASRSESRRRAAISQPAHIKIMTFPQWQTRGHLWSEPTAVVILDEVSAIKGGGSRHAAVLATTETADRVHAFTATVYENDPVEVWTMYRLLGLPALPARHAFDLEFVEWRQYDDRRTAHAWSSRAAARRFRKLIADHYLCRDRCVDDFRRPEYIRHDIWVPLRADQDRAMASADRLAPLRRLQRQEQVITGKRLGASSRALEAAQLVAGLVAQDPTTKVLVVAESLDELDAIANQFMGLGIGHANLRGDTAKDSRPRIVEDFKADPTVGVLLGSRVVERGLNLQFCRHLVSVGLPDNPARLDQAVGRVIRYGSPFPRVDHWLVLNDHECDRKAISRLTRKEAQAALLRS
ncbi:helicase-related protein [Geodermatophilus sp. SYSU D00867]